MCAEGTVTFAHVIFPSAHCVGQGDLISKPDPRQGLVVKPGQVAAPSMVCFLICRLESDKPSPLRNKVHGTLRGLEQVPATAASWGFQPLSPGVNQDVPTSAL